MSSWIVFTNVAGSPRSSGVKPVTKSKQKRRGARGRGRGRERKGEEMRREKKRVEVMYLHCR